MPVRQPLRGGGAAPIVAALVVAISASWCQPSAAVVDGNGVFRVVLFANQGFVFTDTCALVVTQTAMDLSIRGSCQGVANPVNVTGTIDPDSGGFTATGAAGICSAVTITGTVARDSTRFTGTFGCSPHAAIVGVNASRCGNGQIDAGETCDDGNWFERDCCSSNCRNPPEGTACADDGNPCTLDTCSASGQCEHPPRSGTCDDNNSCTVGDSCIAGQCIGAVQPNGRGCNDGNFCTGGDVCRDGVCASGPVECAPCLSCKPRLGCVPTILNACKQAPAHSLLLRNVRTDALQWKWLRGDATQRAELGSPTTTSNYDVCIYDSTFDANGSPRLVLSRRAPAGADWHSTPSGFAYDRPDLTPGGLRRILMQAGPTGRSNVLVKGAGPNLNLPALQSIKFPLTVQAKTLAGDASTCWSASYGRPALRAPQVLRAAWARRGPETRPNIVVINLDDTRADGIDRMPTLTSIAQQGVSFSNSFVVNPLCAPSRASLLTGLSARHHGARALGGVIGGAHIFRELHADQQTIAVWLQNAGYVTGLFGKYVNGYGFGAERTEGPGGTYYVPPGWTRWRGMRSPEHFGGIRGGTYTLVNEHGVPTEYGDHATDQQYSTDLLAAELRTFMGDAVEQGRPFFAHWSPYASHVDVPSLLPEPAERHFQFFRNLDVWRPPSYAELDVSDKPRHIRDLAQGGFALQLISDLIRQHAYESLLAVDEGLSEILRDLEQLGIADNTVIIVTSDNGSLWGEHRGFAQAKECPYEGCLRVPMIVHAPGSVNSPGVRGATVLNLDVAPTVAALAGVVPPVATDGVSFAPWISGPPPAQWRDDFLLEHWRSVRDDRLDYVGQVADGDQVRLLYGDQRARPRASVLFEFDDGSGVAGGAIALPIGGDADATFANLAQVIPVAVPFTSVSHLPASNRLVALDGSAQQFGVYWIVERNEAQAIVHDYVLGDYFGVRDVSGNLTYVEHESGEVELYDLAADPHQLENKAGDPVYASTRQRLAGRLDQLLR